MSNTNISFYPVFDAAPSKQSQNFLNSDLSLTSLDDYSFVFQGMSLPMFDPEMKQDSAANFVQPVSPPYYNTPSPQSTTFDDFSSPSTLSPYSTTIQSEILFDGSLNMDYMFPTLPTVLPQFGLGLLNSSPSTPLNESNSTEASSTSEILPVASELSTNSDTIPTPQLPPSERPKSKVGRKKKPRPTTAEGILAEAMEKRAKNTEAARKSRLKRLEKFESVEVELEEMKKMLSLCISTMNSNGITLPGEVKQFLVR
ncbi:hypothetical protein HK099_007453 [Clydaea vesicula]|uniref:BZIP domain-containing protein n=1 Tax=Clydaea vesicula TaxID=447962 RepID=A0AAD5TX41_9FUNG|nr:hypothetical protein HK099_007453 [Clydaea vesicula]KAJ3386511.1 hypothetical protein HDU92_002421 [Lobulomyces angularis]